MKIIQCAKTAGGAVLAASLAGCGSLSMDSLNPWRGPAERPTTSAADGTAYACDGGRRLVVRDLADIKAVMIVFRERQFRLDQAPSTPAKPGMRYTNGSTTLQWDGDQVSLEEDGAVTYANCRKAAG